MWHDFVLYVRACEDCPALPVLYISIPSHVVDFFANVKGWTLEDWVREKLAKRGIHIPKDFFIEHPVFAYRKGFSRDVLIALPEVVLQ